MDEDQIAFCQRFLEQVHDATLWERAAAGDLDLSESLYLQLKAARQPVRTLDGLQAPYTGSTRRRTVRASMVEAARRRALQPDSGPRNTEVHASAETMSLEAFLEGLGDIRNLVSHDELVALFQAHLEEGTA